MRTNIAFAVFGFVIPLNAQTHETVRFAITPASVSANHAVFVSGSLPELGAGDVARAVKLSDTGTEWRIDVSLPVNTSYTYRFYERDLDPARIGDPNNRRALSAAQTASTSNVSLSPRAKRLLAHSDLSNALLLWRHGSTGSFTQQPMSRRGAGRRAGESRWEAPGFGTARQPIEFYLQDATGSRRDPVSGTYSTTLDAVFLQDGELFLYEPPPAPSPPRRDYVIGNVPRLQSAVLGESRPYRVFLPRGYDQNVSRRYPVLYAHDDFVWFDDPTTADPNATNLIDLMATGQIEEAIVVGIGHEDMTNQRKFFENRFRDYIPPGDFAQTPWGVVAGRADRYAQFVITELKPFIDSRYRTKPDRQNTWSMGFSAGGVAALYLGWDHSATFSRVASFAGALLVPNFMGRIGTEPSRDVRIYLDSGTVADYYGPALQLYDLLVARPEPYAFAESLHLRFGFGQTHTATDVGKRLPFALRFLAPGREAANELLCGSVPYGTGRGGAQTLTLDWIPATGTTGAFSATGGQAGGAGALLFAIAPDDFTLLGLPVLVQLSPLTITAPIAFAANGAATLPFDLRVPSVAGHSFYLQSFAFSGTPAASNGLQIFTCR